MGFSLSAGFRLTLIIGLTLGLIPLQAMLKVFWPTAARYLPRYYHRGIAKLMQVRLRVRGSKIVEDQAALLVANHTSWLDIVILSAIAPASFIAKEEVAGWPLMGLLAKLQSTIFVNRTKRQQTEKTRQLIEARLKTKAQIILFPEGTSGSGNEVLPFKSSFFGAVPEGTPIYPITIAYARYWGLPMTRRERPFYAWYGQMPFLSHFLAALKQGPITIIVEISQPLLLPAASSRKMIASVAESTIRQNLSTLLHGEAKIS